MTESFYSEITTFSHIFQSCFPVSRSFQKFFAEHLLATPVEFFISNNETLEIPEAVITDFQIWIKYQEALSYFRKVFFHHNLNGTRFLSPEISVLVASLDARQFKTQELRKLGISRYSLKYLELHNAQLGIQNENVDNCNRKLQAINFQTFYTKKLLYLIL